MVEMDKDGPIGMMPSASRAGKVKPHEPPCPLSLLATVGGPAVRQTMVLSKHCILFSKDVHLAGPAAGGRARRLQLGSHRGTALPVPNAVHLSTQQANRTAAPGTGAGMDGHQDTRVYHGVGGRTMTGSLLSFLQR